MADPANRANRVLIAGGGVAALEAALALRDLAGDRVSIELLSPARDFTYRQLSTAEAFDVGEVYRFDLAEVCQAIGCEFRPEGIARLNADAKTVETESGNLIGYDVLLLAHGARAISALPGATTFWGRGEDDEFREIVRDLADGSADSAAFVIPGFSGWGLPLYELAMMTAERIGARRAAEVDLYLVTPEEHPLGLLGGKASEKVGRLLEQKGIAFVGESRAANIADGVLELVPHGAIKADRFVALPGLEGREIPGVPGDDRGFVPVDDECRVLGTTGVYAAGDCTTQPVKQGGLAAQQAESAARMIARDAGADVELQPYRPVLRGLLLTGSATQYLRAPITGGEGDASEAATVALWWPPSKVAGPRLAPFLESYSGSSIGIRPDSEGRVEVAEPLAASSTTGVPAAG